MILIIKIIKNIIKDNLNDFKKKKNENDNWFKNETHSLFLFQIHFGTCLARMYLAANVIGINCAAGMSELIKKDILEV